MDTAAATRDAYCQGIIGPDIMRETFGYMPLFVIPEERTSDPLPDSWDSFDPARMERITQWNAQYTTDAMAIKGWLGDGDASALAAVKAQAVMNQAEFGVPMSTFMGDEPQAAVPIINMGQTANAATAAGATILPDVEPTHLAAAASGLGSPGEHTAGLPSGGPLPAVAALVRGDAVVGVMEVRSALG